MFELLQLDKSFVQQVHQLLLDLEYFLKSRRGRAKICGLRFTPSFSL